MTTGFYYNPVVSADKLFFLDGILCMDADLTAVYPYCTPQGTSDICTLDSSRVSYTTLILPATTPEIFPSLDFIRTNFPELLL